MKIFKKFLSIFLVIGTIFILSGCRKDRYKIVLSEVTHSVFYAPQYVALAKGYFEEEGLKITLINSNGADKVMSALLSKKAQIGLMGPEASIYVYNQGRKNYAINFIQLTQRDGSFLVGREPIEDFTFDMLKGKSILGGRKGGVPVMTLQYVLRNKGLDAVLDDTTKEVNIRTDVQYGVLAGAFLSGEGDFVTLFEPGATNLEKEGKGYVLASIGAESGNIPFTAYSATKDYIEKNPDIIQKFTNAIYKGQKWVQEYSAREIAEVIHQYFSETPLDDLTIVMQRYKDIDAWCTTPFFAKDGLERLMDVMEQAGELDKRAPYEKIVDNTFANKATGK